MIKIETVTPRRDALGECPLWDQRSQSVFWIDSHRHLVRRHTPSGGAYREWLLPSAIGSIALCESGRLMVALEREFVYLNLETGLQTTIGGVTHAVDRIRLNDGRTDRAGRFLVGTVVMGRPDKLGALYQLDASGKIRQVDNGFACGNAICFSPLGDWLYFTDSHTRKVMRYPYNTVSGANGKPEVFIDTSPLGSGPDGAAVDSDGCLWAALVQVGKLARYTPDGKLERLIEMPVRHVSCLCFGGPNLDILFVTSISDSGNALKDDHPDAGALFAIHGTGVRGLPEVRFADLH